MFELPHTPQSAGQDRGFTIVELLATMTVVGLLLAIVAPSLASAQRRRADRELPAAAAVLWDGINAWRMDNNGELPPASSATRQGIADSSGQPYIAQWPAEALSTGFLVSADGGPANPSLAGPNRTVVYTRTTNWTGWIAVYGSRGTLVFARTIASGDDPAAAAAGAVG